MKTVHLNIWFVFFAWRNEKHLARDRAHKTNAVSISLYYSTLIGSLCMPLNTALTLFSLHRFSVHRASFAVSCVRRSISFTYIQRQGKCRCIYNPYFTMVIVKAKNDHLSKFSNLSNWKEEAWKNQSFNGIRTRWGPDFFRLLLSNCLNWKIYCDDHSSLSSTTAVRKWIISSILHNGNCLRQPILRVLLGP